MPRTSSISTSMFTDSYSFRDLTGRLFINDLVTVVCLSYSGTVELSISKPHDDHLFLIKNNQLSINIDEFRRTLLWGLLEIYRYWSEVGRLQFHPYFRVRNNGRGIELKIPRNATMSPNSVIEIVFPKVLNEREWDPWSSVVYVRWNACEKGNKMSERGARF